VLGRAVLDPIFRLAALESIRDATEEDRKNSSIVRRAFDQARPLLLAAVGGEPSDAAVVWRHARRIAMLTIGIGTGGQQNAADFGERDREGKRQVSEKLGSEKRQFGCLVATRGRPGPLQSKAL